MNQEIGFCVPVPTGWMMEFLKAHLTQPIFTLEKYFPQDQEDASTLEQIKLFMLE
jgi:hypothetical protein